LIGSVSCGQDSDNVNIGTTASENNKTEVTAELSESDQHPLPEVDMNGFQLNFYTYDDTYITWAINTIDTQLENGDRINDTIYQRNRRIEEKYNADINVTAVSKPTDNFSQLMLSGDTSYDIVMIYDEQVAPYYCEGLLQSWDCLKYADTERSWWNQDANEVFQIKGKQFAAVGDFSLVMYSRGFVLLYNKDMYNAANLPDNLYDLVRGRTWTIDKFAEIAKHFTKDLNGDSVMDAKDQYSAAGAIKLHFGSLVTGAGVKYIDTDKEGKPYFAISGNTYAFDVFEKIFNLHNSDNFFYAPVKDVHNGSNESRVMFSAGQTLFQGTSTKGISNYRDCKFDIGILPYPKYDKSQENYYILTSGAEVATIPVTLPEERMENVGILLDVMCRDSQQNLLPTYQEVVLKTKYTRDDDSAEMLDIIFNSAAFDLGLSVWPGVTYYKYMENYLNMVDNFSSMTAELETQVKDKIDTLFTALNKIKN
jgi:hypothetical protein